VTADGSYILFQMVSSENDEVVVRTACGPIDQGGIVETQVDINSTADIFNGTVIGGFLSDDGQFFCAVDGE